MAENADYTPAPQYQGHNFASAHKAFDVNAGRGYTQAIENRTDASKFVPDRISTTSSRPWFIRCDVSGSMGGWPNPIVAKWPYLAHEVQTEYLGKDAELSIGAHCDVADRFPLQIIDFAKADDMLAATKKLMFTSGGTGSDHYCEAHGVVALYDLRNAHTPNAIEKPPYILITDEMPHPTLSRDDAKSIAKVGFEEHTLKTAEIFEELMERFSVYVILKPYHDGDAANDTLKGITQMVFDRWVGIVGIERIAILPDPNRVVDVIFGILAKETGKIAYFRDELEARQLPDKDGKAKVDTVYRSLKTIHLLPSAKKGANSATGHSKTTGLGSGKKTKSLLD